MQRKVIGEQQQFKGQLSSDPMDRQFSAETQVSHMVVSLTLFINGV